MRRARPPHLRVARPTDNLEAIVAMYRDGLSLESLGEFQDHDGFDGVMLGADGAGYHLEFTRQRGGTAGGTPSPENVLVFYLPDRREWEATCGRMVAAGFKAVASHNPYWDRAGRTYRDLDGYRVVIQCAAWV